VLVSAASSWRSAGSSETDLSIADRIAALLDEALGAWLPGEKHRAVLHLVVTPLAGVDGGPDGATGWRERRLNKSRGSDKRGRLGQLRP
jgi:hypothetical protein